MFTSLRSGADDKRKLKVNSELYADYYPTPKDNEGENKLTDENVKRGYRDVEIVKDEILSYFETTPRDKLDTTSLRTRLQATLNRIQTGKRERNRFQHNRDAQVNFPDLKIVSDKHLWMVGLAAGALAKPLSEIHSATHGFKETALLEALAGNRVAYLRATWYAKVYQLNNVKNPTAEGRKDARAEALTAVVLDFFQETMGMVLRRGEQKSKTKGINWAGADGKMKWFYVLQLINYFYEQGMLDREMFLTALLERWDGTQTCVQRQGMNTTVHAATCAREMPSLAVLLPYLHDIFRQLGLLRMFVDICTRKLQQARDQHPQEDAYVVQLLHRLLQQAMCASPDIYVLLPLARGVGAVEGAEKRSVVGCNSASAMSADASARLGRLRSALQPEGASGDSLFFIGVLDDELERGDWADVYARLVPRLLRLGPPTPEAVSALCHWAVTRERPGAERVWVAAALLARWRKASEDEDEMHDYLMAFLDAYQPADEAEFGAVETLFGELVRHRAFSHDRFIKKCVSRGILSGTADARDERFRRYVESIPAFESDASELIARRNALFGAAKRDEMERLQQVQTRLRSCLRHRGEDFFAERSSPDPDPPLSVCAAEALLESLPRFYRVRVTAWLAAAVKGAVRLKDARASSSQRDESRSISAPQLALALSWLELAQDFESLADLVAFLVGAAHAVYDAVVSRCVARNRTMFSAQDRLQSLGPLLKQRAENVDSEWGVVYNSVCSLFPSLTFVPVPGQSRVSVPAGPGSSSVAGMSALTITPTTDIPGVISRTKAQCQGNPSKIGAAIASTVKGVGGRGWDLDQFVRYTCALVWALPGADVPQGLAEHLGAALPSALTSPTFPGVVSFCLGLVTHHVLTLDRLIVHVCLPSLTPRTGKEPMRKLLEFVSGLLGLGASLPEFSSQHEAASLVTARRQLQPDTLLALLYTLDTLRSLAPPPLPDPTPLGAAAGPSPEQVYQGILASPMLCRAAAVRPAALLDATQRHFARADAATRRNLIASLLCTAREAPVPEDALVFPAAGASEVEVTHAALSACCTSLAEPSMWIVPRVSLEVRLLMDCWRHLTEPQVAERRQASLLLALLINTPASSAVFVALANKLGDPVEAEMRRQLLDMFRFDLGLEMGQSTMQTAGLLVDLGVLPDVPTLITDTHALRALHDLLLALFRPRPGAPLSASHAPELFQLLISQFGGSAAALASVLATGGERVFRAHVRFRLHVLLALLPMVGAGADAIAAVLKLIAMLSQNAGCCDLLPLALDVLGALCHGIPGTDGTAEHAAERSLHDTRSLQDLVAELPLSTDVRARLLTVLPASGEVKPKSARLYHTPGASPAMASPYTMSTPPEGMVLASTLNIGMMTAATPTTATGAAQEAAPPLDPWKLLPDNPRGHLSLALFGATRLERRELSYRAPVVVGVGVAREIRKRKAGTPRAGQTSSLFDPPGKRARYV